MVTAVATPEVEAVQEPEQAQEPAGELIPVTPPGPVVNEQLSEGERERRDALMAEARKYEAATGKFWGILTTIAQEKLYRDYGTLEDFFAAQFPKISRRRAWQMIASERSVRAIQSLKPKTTPPQSERQTRPLDKLADEKDQADAWEEATEAAGGVPSGAQVEAAVAKKVAAGAKTKNRGAGSRGKTFGSTAGVFKQKQNVIEYGFSAPDALRLQVPELKVFQVETLFNLTKGVPPDVLVALINQWADAGLITLEGSGD